MEWAIHETLAEQKNVSADEMKTILIQVLDGAAYIHEQGMAHRAIQPSNILIVSRKPMECKLGGIGLSGLLAYKTPEVTLRGSYLPSDYSVDIWSIGVLTLQYSLFNRWLARTSEWPSRSSIKSQVSRPTWQALTDFANFMLEPDPRNRPSATTCSTKLSRVEATKSEEAQQHLMNLDFLRVQKDIPDVPNSYLSLLEFQPNSELNTSITVDHLKARKILGISFKEWDSLLERAARKVHYDAKKSRPLALTDLATLLEASNETRNWTDAIYLRRLQQYVEKAHLAEKSLLVGFVPL